MKIIKREFETTIKEQEKDLGEEFYIKYDGRTGYEFFGRYKQVYNGEIRIFEIIVGNKFIDKKLVPFSFEHTDSHVEELLNKHRGRVVDKSQFLGKYTEILNFLNENICK